MVKRDVIGFVLLECLIYGTFTVIDIGSSDVFRIRVSLALKLVSIALCLAFLVRLMSIQPKNRDNHLMVLIMSLTLASDVFLLLTRQFIYGLILFVCVQLLYSIRIQKRLKMKSVLIKGSLFIASLLFFMQRLPQHFSYALLLSLGAFYALLFTMNLFSLSHEIWSTSGAKGDSKFADTEAAYDRRLFLTGLVLYALCDLNVVIYNFPTFFASNEVFARIFEMSALAMWLFYLPGQVALTLSVRRKVDDTSGG